MASTRTTTKEPQDFPSALQELVPMIANAMTANGATVKFCQQLMMVIIAKKNSLMHQGQQGQGQPHPPMGQPPMGGMGGPGMGGPGMGGPGEPPPGMSMPGGPAGGGAVNPMQPSLGAPSGPPMGSPNGPVPGIMQGQRDITPDELRRVLALSAGK